MNFRNLKSKYFFNELYTLQYIILLIIVPLLTSMTSFVLGITRRPTFLHFEATYQSYTTLVLGV